MPNRDVYHSSMLSADTKAYIERTVKKRLFGVAAIIMYAFILLLLASTMAVIAVRVEVGWEKSVGIIGITLVILGVLKWIMIDNTGALDDVQSGNYRYYIGSVTDKVQQSSSRYVYVDDRQLQLLDDSKYDDTRLGDSMMVLFSKHFQYCLPMPEQTAES